MKGNKAFEVFTESCRLVRGSETILVIAHPWAACWKFLRLSKDGISRYRETYWMMRMSGCAYMHTKKSGTTEKNYFVSFMFLKEHKRDVFVLSGILVLILRRQDLTIKVENPFAITADHFCLKKNWYIQNQHRKSECSCEYSIVISAFMKTTMNCFWQW